MLLQVLQNRASPLDQPMIHDLSLLPRLRPEFLGLLKQGHLLSFFLKLLLILLFLLRLVA